MNDKDFEEFLKDKVCDWCVRHTELPKLHDYLRMSRKEYYIWLATGKLLPGIKSRWGLKED